MPDPRITVSVNDQEHELFMSFALLNRLAAIIGDTNQNAVVAIDSTVRDMVIREVLTQKGKRGILPKDFDMDEDVDMSIDDAFKILTWASEHVLDFFIKAVKTAVEIAEKAAPQMKDLENLQASRTGTQS